MYTDKHNSTGDWDKTLCVFTKDRNNKTDVCGKKNHGVKQDKIRSFILSFGHRKFYAFNGGINKIDFK